MIRLPRKHRRTTLGGRLRALGLLIAMVPIAVAGGCAQNQTATGTILPDLVKEPTKLLTKDEQKRVITDLAHVKDTELVSAEKRIEKGR